EADRSVAHRPVRPDIRIVGNRPPDEVLNDLAPTLAKYKAVFATTLALARATQVRDPHIPIVFDGAANPVEMCLVDSLQAPRRNATGYANYLTADEAKMVEGLADGFPEMRTVYFLLDPESYYPEGCTDEVVRPPPTCRAGVRAADDYVRRMADV